jgi:EmrB/QacA subfamily drug resistance transporter
VTSAAAQSVCDAALARCVQPHTPAARPREVLATTILASSLAFVDGSVINVGLPAIGRDFGADPGTLQWVVNAYLLPLSALLLLGGATGDRFGRRRLLVAGTGLFALASVGCALAPDTATLLGARLLQGAAAAMLLPNSLAILGTTFSGRAKGRAVGVWAAAGAAAGAVGPVLGGWLIDLGSWRGIFLINLPLAAGAIVLALRSITRDCAGAEQRLDVAGGILTTVGLGALTWALTVGSGPSGWQPTALAAAAAAASLLILFVVLENHRGDRAMMPLALFASRSFTGITLFTMFLYGALGALSVLVPYVLIEAGGYSGSGAGAALLPLPVMLSLTSPWMGGLASRMGPRSPLAAGAAVVAGGFVLALRIGSAPDYWTDVLPAVFVIALGMSAAVAPLTAAVLNSVDPGHAGSASGFNSAVARLGGLMATALVGSVLAARGEYLVLAFHAAIIAGAVLCGVASLIALALLPGKAAGPAPGL